MAKIVVRNLTPNTLGAPAMAVVGLGCAGGFGFAREVDAAGVFGVVVIQLVVVLVHHLVLGVG